MGAHSGAVATAPGRSNDARKDGGTALVEVTPHVERDADDTRR